MNERQNIKYQCLQLAIKTYCCKCIHDLNRPDYPLPDENIQRRADTFEQYVTELNKAGYKNVLKDVDDYKNG